MLFNLECLVLCYVDNCLYLCSLLTILLLVFRFKDSDYLFGLVWFGFYGV